MTDFLIAARSLRQAPAASLILVCVSSLLACGNASGERGRRHAVASVDTSNGVLVTKNGEAGLWAPGEKWTLEQEFRLGGAEGPEEELFGGPLMSVSLGPQGQIYVQDAQANTIKVFDGEGRFLREFGGPGPGPGELINPVAMGWDGRERLWVATAFNFRYTVFDSTGGLIKTVRRPIRGMSHVQYRLVFRGGGSFIDEAQKLQLLRVDTTGAVLDSLPRVQPPDHSASRILPPDFDRSALAYRPRVVWTVAPDGTIWSAESGELRLVRRSGEGDTLQIVETRHRQASLDPETERWAEREFSKLGLDRSDYRLIRPLVQTIHVMDDGHVLVQIIDEVGRDGHLLDVFDPDGRFLGTLDLGFRLNGAAVPALVGDTVVAVTSGELDVPYVVRATIRRTTSARVQTVRRPPQPAMH